jgi:hypothetical protein
MAIVFWKVRADVLLEALESVRGVGSDVVIADVPGHAIPSRQQHHVQSAIQEASD